MPARWSRLGVQLALHEFTGQVLGQGQQALVKRRLWRTRMALMNRDSHTSGLVPALRGWKGTPLASPPSVRAIAHDPTIPELTSAGSRERSLHAERRASDLAAQVIPRQRLSSRACRLLRVRLECTRRRARDPITATGAGSAIPAPDPERSNQVALTGDWP